jgi:hypothetical protein
MRVSRYFTISRWIDLSNLERSRSARSSNSIVQAKISLHLFKGQSFPWTFQAFCGDRNVFQIIQTRLDCFAKEDVSGLASTLRCLVDLFGKLVGDLNSSHKASLMRL